MSVRFVIPLYCNHFYDSFVEFRVYAGTLCAAVGLESFEKICTAVWLRGWAGRFGIWVVRGFL